MKKRCESPNCSLNSNESLFQLPSDPIMRAKWLDALYDAYPNLKLRKNVFICEKHFKITDFNHVLTDESGKIIQQEKTKKKRLRPEAVPQFINLQSHNMSDKTDTVINSSRLMATPKTGPSTSDGTNSTHVYINEIGQIIQNTATEEKSPKSKPKQSTSHVTDCIHVQIDENGEIIHQNRAPKRKRLTHVANSTDDSTPLTGISTMRNHPRPSTSGVLTSRPSFLQKETKNITQNDRWIQCDSYFEENFIQNDFGVACDVCDRLWFATDLKSVTAQQADVLVPAFPTEAEDGSLTRFKVCKTCYLSLNKKHKIPTLAKTNGFQYPPKPMNLPPLDPISERLVSPRLPFMQIRRLRREGAYAIVGQVINVPVDVNTMVMTLPRQLDDDQAFNVNIKRNLIHKSSYLQGYVRKSVIKAWLRYLINTPLYRHYNITVNWDFLHGSDSAGELETNTGTIKNVPLIEPMQVDGDEQVPESEILLARQQTLLWHENLCLDIAPGAHSKPMNLLYDRHAEELSFPGIYYGVPRTFNADISVTPYMIATSEIRRRDRRGVIPAHVLYMGMKILRHRVVQGLHSTFKCVRETESITREMLEKKEFVDDCLNKDLAFLKSIPNSMQYWADRKKDLFAMLRQLGKPTMFLTLSANEIRWPHLLNILYKLSDHSHNNHVENLLTDLTRAQRCNLVSEDPVTCCIYFNKLVEVIMHMLQSSQSWNPFGQYRVIDYFKRIEFQHRGSPHAHILLWLENDPKEQVGETMPKTIELIETLCSVSRNDVSEARYGNQVHQHTFTCTKRGETSCRFNIPYWPSEKTRVLLPMSKEDKRREDLRKKATKLREILETQVYDDMESFLKDNNLTLVSYLNIIRSTLHRPTLLFKRTHDEIYTNTFNPWICKILNSNMDLQFILDEYSCAAYVVEYVNKSDRGISNLHRHLLKMEESHEEDYNSLLKRIGLQVLNMVEMSSQEAAWYLLRQPMSHCSRQVIYLPTVWPHERQKSRKKKTVMDRENIAPDSTDIWTKNIIQQYEERPSELEDRYLADFAANYTRRRTSTTLPTEDTDDEDAPEPKRSRIQRDKRTRHDDNMSEEESDSNSDTDSAQNQLHSYRKRHRSRIIRYRHYNIEDVENYKREMVLLYLPFRNELVEVLDRDKFIQLFDSNEELIMKRRKKYEANIDIEQVMAALKELCASKEEPVINLEPREQFVTSVLGDKQDNTDDIDSIIPNELYAIVRPRANLMPKQQYCEMLRSTNPEQRELLLEVIHRLHTPNAEPLQIFFTGPAGCGKTYVLKAIMETVNRYTQEKNSLRNAYIACASTGKAAVNLSGTTVHSAFVLAPSSGRNEHELSPEQLHNFRNLFRGVEYIIIDEVSMIGAHLLQKIHSRLQQITGVTDKPFGGMNIIFCGDLRQLPPVSARPIYQPSREAIGGATLWQALDYFPLTRVVRQSDVTFSTMLTKIGNGDPLSQYEIEIIESRFHTVKWCDENVPDATRLYHRNVDVDYYNMKKIHPTLQSVAIDAITGYKSKEELVNARTHLHKLTTVETGGLPYLINLATGYPYMITTNIDVIDGLVNGVIGELKYIEVMDNLDQPDPIAGPSHSRDDDVNSIRSQNIRVWLHFPQEQIGHQARIKCRPHVMAHRNTLQPDWTPLSKITGSISLSKLIKCKRTQLPLIPACAITIHKSQGGTFEEIVFHYEKKQSTQLVYVALSRVTTIEGLYMTHPSDCFKFYHVKNNDSPAMKSMRDEYLRLDRHHLYTLTRSAEEFCGTSNSIGKSNNNIIDKSQRIIIVNMNVQSLLAHNGDIASDPILQHAEYLVCTETWLSDDKPPTEIPGFTCESRQNICSHTDRRLAGGVAIYKNMESFTTCQSIRIRDRTFMTTDLIGDFTSIDVVFNDTTQFVLASVYIHPGIASKKIEMFLLKSLLEYSVHRHHSMTDPDTHTPIVLCGDFNINIFENETLVKFMENEFNLKIHQSHPTTLGNTNLDLTFVRNINIETFCYISYFSYHRPVLNKLMIK